MIEGILGKKVGMTHIFSEGGAQLPVTVIETGGCHVVQKKTREKDGYDAVQISLGEKKDKRASRAMQGHFKKAGVPCAYHLVEFRGAGLDELKPGQLINAADVFQVGDVVDVVGRSKGKGFQGSMKRHHFRGGKDSHGSMHNRAPGSIGSSSDPSRVFKGMKMAGHMGDATATTQNLRVVEIRPEENLLLVCGSVPGSVNSLIVVRKAHKKAARAAKK